MTKPRHPNKTIEAALAKMEDLGWTVETSKGRSAHAWGFVRCPQNAKDKCRNGVFCQTQVWSTPRNPTSHARDILRKARGCVMYNDERGDENDG